MVFRSIDIISVVIEAISLVEALPIYIKSVELPIIVSSLIDKYLESNVPIIMAKIVRAYISFLQWMLFVVHHLTRNLDKLYVWLLGQLLPALHFFFLSS